MPHQAESNAVVLARYQGENMQGSYSGGWRIVTCMPYLPAYGLCRGIWWALCRMLDYMALIQKDSHDHMMDATEIARKGVEKGQTQQGGRCFPDKETVP